MNKKIWIIAKRLISAKNQKTFNRRLRKVITLNIEDKEALLIAVLSFARVQWYLIENHWGQSITSALGMKVEELWPEKNNKKAA